MNVLLNVTFFSPSFLFSSRAAHLLNEIWKFLHVVGDILSNRLQNYCSTFVLSELLEIILPSDQMWEKLRENLSFVSITKICLLNLLVKYHVWLHDNSVSSLA